jgi:hypothetical protein
MARIASGGWSIEDEDTAGVLVHGLIEIYEFSLVLSF